MHTSQQNEDNMELRSSFYFRQRFLRCFGSRGTNPKAIVAAKAGNAVRLAVTKLLQKSDNQRRFNVGSTDSRPFQECVFRNRMLVIAVVLLNLASSFAQSGSPSIGPSLAELKMRLKRAQADVELEPILRQQVIDLYAAAMERIEIATEATSIAAAFSKRTNSVNDELQTIQAKRKSVSDATSLTVTTAFSLVGDDIDKLERMRLASRERIEHPDHGLRVMAADAQKKLVGRMTRLKEIANALSEVDARIETIQEDLDSPNAANEPQELNHAREMLLLTRKMRATEERAALHAEQTWCESDDVAELLRAEWELRALELSVADAESQILHDAVYQKRGSEADQQVRKSELIVAQAAPLLKTVAEDNLFLAKELRDLSKTFRKTTEIIDQTSRDHRQIEADFTRVHQMVDAVGLTDSIGLLLRQQRVKLGNSRDLNTRLAQRGEQVRQVQMRHFQMDADLAAISDLDKASTKIAGELTAREVARQGTTTPDISPSIPQLAQETRLLLTLRRDFLESLSDNYQTQFKQLVSLDIEERKLGQSTREYAEYIDERVLWIRTGPFFGGVQLANVALNSAWLTERANWLKVGTAIQQDCEKEPLIYMIAALMLISWAAMRGSLLGHLRMLGTVADDVSCHHLKPTLQAVFLTVLMAGVIPSVLAFLGWRLDQVESSSTFVDALSSGLWRAAVCAFPFELLQLMVLQGGLAEKHFDWSPLTTLRMRRQWRWFPPVCIALIGLVGMVEATSDEQRLDSLGRFCFLMVVILFVIFCLMTFPQLHSRTPPARKAATFDSQSARRSEESADETDVWFRRASKLGRICAFVIPLGLLILSWTGYFYTALQLTWRLQYTAWLAVSLTLLRSIVIRWITIERRRIAILQAEELHAIAEAGKHPETETQTPFLFPRWTWPDFRLNLTQIVTQIRGLLDTVLFTIAGVGLWCAWSDVAPALNILDRVPLWQITEVVPSNREDVLSSKDGQDQASVNGRTQPAMVTKRRAVTAANLGLALLVLSIAIVAGRNIPGLVEVILLEYFSVDAGIRFATTCLVRYAIFMAGVCLAFSQIGIGWSSVQWLVAAASVGLGFGLQEIFANFVSGIILLFERPMRVGDVITIGDTTGTVSRIRFRATTIIDGDRRELIVPNKSFITGNLLNWTLSDSVNRLAIKVYVGPGNEPEQIRELLLKIARENLTLLKDPAPSAALEEIGANGLLFVLRAFLPTLKDRPRASHDLHTAIHRRFRDARIEMPCPTQEVLVRMPKSEINGIQPIDDVHAPLDEAVKQAGVSV